MPKFRGVRKTTKKKIVGIAGLLPQVRSLDHPYIYTYIYMCVCEYIYMCVYHIHRHSLLI